MSFPLGFISSPHVSTDQNSLAMTQSHCDAVTGIAWWVSYVNPYPIWTAWNLLARLFASVITAWELRVINTTYKWRSNWSWKWVAALLPPLVFKKSTLNVVQGRTIQRQKTVQGGRLEFGIHWQLFMKQNWILDEKYWYSEIAIIYFLHGRKSCKTRNRRKKDSPKFNTAWSGAVVTNNNYFFLFKEGIYLSTSSCVSNGRNLSG